MDRVDTNIDEEKRGKLLVLAGLLALAIFISKITQSQTQIILSKVYLNAIIYLLITFFGLLWAFNFQVKKRSLLFLLQSALYVYSQYIFIEFFFFQKFNRIYEVFILLGLMFFAFAGHYISFLMANVLNVDLFKKIPLAQVGRTSSYLISLLTLYFLTFSILTSGFPFYIVLPLIFFSYLLVIVIHYLNIGVEWGELYRKGGLTLLIVYFLFLGVFLTGNYHEVVSAIPVLGYYFAVGVVSQESVVYGGLKGVSVYTVILVLCFLVAVFVSLLSL